MSPYSRIGWDGKTFAVLDQKETHPIVCVRWPGAAVYCNWLSAQQRLPHCYNTTTWDCDFNKSGFRLPTEAEWEYAARGGQQNPYWNFPWGERAGCRPRPTGRNRRTRIARARCPGRRRSVSSTASCIARPTSAGRARRRLFRPPNGANGYGLYDMAGNVWQFVNDWYDRDYYAYSPADNPPGPAAGSLMPDGKPYRGMRGGNWYNGENGHSRVSNRNPSYFRGPQDPDHPYYHIGFRVVLPVDAESRPVIKPTPVQRAARPTRLGSRPPRADRPDREPSRGDDEPAARTEGGDARRSDERPAADEADSTARQSPQAALRLRAPQSRGGRRRDAAEGVHRRRQQRHAAAGVERGAGRHQELRAHHAPRRSRHDQMVLDALQHPGRRVQPAEEREGRSARWATTASTANWPMPRRIPRAPATKKYTYTVYALSAAPQITVPPAEVSRDVLLAAMKDLILATRRTERRLHAGTRNGRGR